MSNKAHDKKRLVFPLEHGDIKKPVTVHFIYPSQVVPYRPKQALQATDHKLTINIGQENQLNHIYKAYVQQGKAWLDDDNPDGLEYKDYSFNPAEADHDDLRAFCAKRGLRNESNRVTESYRLEAERLLYEFGG